MARGGVNDVVFYGVLLGGSYVGYRTALTGGLGAAAQKTAFDLAVALKGRSAAYKEIQPYILPENKDKITGVDGGAPPPGGVPTTVTDAQIVAWARDIGLDPCVGRAFVRARGALPTSVSELVTWGNSNGMRSADGSWHC